MEALPSQKDRLTTNSTSTIETPSEISRSGSKIIFPSGGSEVDSHSSYGIDQNLASILNNPHVGKSGVYGSDPSWGIWWPSTSASSAESTPLIANRSFPEVSLGDFQAYLNSIIEGYGRFEDIRNHSSKDNSEFETLYAPTSNTNGESDFRGQGEALVTCLREVPALYFKEDFALEDGTTFRAACPFSTITENIVLQEKLTHYLDIVELYLVKEIALRSDSFFVAQGKLQDLNLKILMSCNQIRDLRDTIRLLENDLVACARTIQDLNATRNNLLALQEKLKLILYVNQALSALKMLVAAADCAGALDVIDDMQNLLESDELAGLHCFRHLRDELAMSIDCINSVLSTEFMRASISGIKNVDSVALSKVKPVSDAVMNGKEDDIIDDETSSAFRDRLLPIIVGLIRTAKLPSVLRIYRETLIAEMKTTIKTTVADMLSVLSARSLESDFTSGERLVDADGSSSLASKLRKLSCEAFVQLLTAIFEVVQAHLISAAEVKKIIEWVMSSLDKYFGADSVSQENLKGEILLESNGQLGSYLSYSLQKNIFRGSSLQLKTTETSSPNAMKNFRADVLRENTEAVFAACDAAHGRWAKLLGVRALLHPKLRLQEFLSIYNVTQDFMTVTEKIGGRLGYSIRGTLQSQSKSFIDFQHESRMAKLKAVLDQETWVAIDVPEEFQSIVNSFVSFGVLIEEDQQRTRLNASGDSSIVHNPRQTEPLPFLGVADEQKMESSASVRSTDGNRHDQGRPTSQTILHRGIGYHMVNCGLILLKMLSEYLDISKYLPALSSEVVHRIVEIMKYFNTRSCQLVLGAGALQVSGLKSITSKHLALASQVISFICAIIPDIKQIIFFKMPESRKSLLMAEIDRVSQDYQVHRDEIHNKLVQIMRERLLFHLRGLPQIVDSWNKADESDSQPSQFARSLTKEVGLLQRVLSRTLHEKNVQAIFRQVVQIFHTQITDAFSNLEINTPQAKRGLYRDIQHILGCMHMLPSDEVIKDRVPNSGKLDEFLVHMFGEEANE